MLHEVWIVMFLRQKNGVSLPVGVCQTRSGGRHTTFFVGHVHDLNALK